MILASNRPYVRAVTGLAPLAVVDVHYAGEGGAAACVVAESWSSATAIEARTLWIPRVEAYRPGAFYERELPCLEAMLGTIQAAPSVIVVDGYVVLDADGRPGLGAHLHDRLGGRVPVVGVAKTAFRGSDFAIAVTRGTSRSPLFVTARGLDVAVAADLVRGMHGEHRIPTLLGLVDRLARDAAAASSGRP